MGTAENALNSALGADFDPAALTDGFGGLRGLMDLTLFGLTNESISPTTKPNCSPRRGNPSLS